MLQRAFKMSLLLFSGWLLAGPLALLQLGAWGWMLASYSQESTFEQALVETFGDERPCDVCRVIDAVEAAEKDSSPAQSGNQEIKLMLGLGRAIKVAAPTSAYEPKTTIVCVPENALRAVPTPPPREA